jgi:AmiR/NasT family two-component response regulator
MKPVTVVLAIADPITSEALTNSLRPHFRVVLPIAGLAEVRPVVLKHRADVVVVDLESTSADEITSLLLEFSALSVVCIHRLADERLWSSVLAAGALDCCHPSDTRGIVMAVNRDGKLAQGHAA